MSDQHLSIENHQRFSGDLRLLLLLFLLLILLTTSSALAQSLPSGWSGDVQFFEYDEGVLHYRDDGEVGQAKLTYKYGKPTNNFLVWDFGTRFDTLPTSQNSFSLTLFYIERDQTLYRYYIEPSIQANTIQLKLEYSSRRNNSWEPISSRILDEHQFRFLATAYSRLDIRVIYEVGKGIVMQSFSPHGDLQVSQEIIPIETGTFKGEMVLETRFTSKKKLGFSFILPIVSQKNEQNEDEEIRIIDSTIDRKGEIQLKLNKQVNASNATVTCDGYKPTITNGESADILLIYLGASFQSNKEYQFTITGLENLQGGKENLEFSFITTDEFESKTEMPNGIFITEIMANPPTSGRLSGIKYIELYNNSGHEINLGEVILQYRSTKYPLPYYQWASGTFAVLFLESAPYPTNSALLVPLPSFPALSGSFSLKLLNVNNDKLDEVNFSDRMYGEGHKKGLASVERIAYSPDIWRRSDHPNGGTPGAHTTMLPYRSVASKSVVINELMLSPSSTGEKYIELYNTSSEVIDVSDLYLTYANKEESSSFTSWLPVNYTTKLNPGDYVVLCPFPESLLKLFPRNNPDTFIERIDFPSISPTYSEIELRSHKDDQLIDKATYRRQWLGEESGDRTGYSLERIAPLSDGTVRSNWKRASSNSHDGKGGGTPGVRNSAFGGYPSPDGSGSTWSDTPDIQEIEQLYQMLESYSHLADLEIFTLDGALLYTTRGEEIRNILDKVRRGDTPYPTMLLVIRVVFRDEERDPATVSYGSVWLNTRNS